MNKFLLFVATTTTLAVLMFFDNELVNFPALGEKPPINPQTGLSSPSPPELIPSLSIADAEESINGWQIYKKTLFGPAYDASRVLDFLDKDGSAYQENILGRSEKPSNLDWLKLNNVYHIYETQNSRTLELTQTNQYATVQAAVREKRTVYANGQPQPKDRHSNPGISEYYVRYILKYENGVWRISSYKVL